MLALGIVVLGVGCYRESIWFKVIGGVGTTVDVLLSIANQIRHK